MTQVLVLGGTGFFGPAIVDAAVARGWDITTFSRHPARDDSRIRAVRGDRMRPETLAAIADREWDIVVDTWASDSRAVRWSTTALDGRVDVYAYVSSISVYNEPLAVGFDECAPLVDLRTGQVEYALAKRRAEIAVLEARGIDRPLILRPGAIVGPRENTGRLLYWLGRAAGGKPFLAPPASTRLQWVDARDLAEFTVGFVEAGTGSVFNVVSGGDEMTFGGMIETCLTVAASRATPIHADDSWLQANGVQPWLDLPLWLPAASPDANVFTATADRARAAGYKGRQLADTVRDTWQWWSTRRGAEPERGLSEGRERELVARLLAGTDDPAT